MFGAVFDRECKHLLRCFIYCAEVPIVLNLSSLDDIQKLDFD